MGPRPRRPDNTRGARLAGALTAALALCACTEDPRPLTCKADDECRAGERCDDICVPVLCGSCPADFTCRNGRCVRCTATEQACDDGFDDDCDGAVDCGDSNCEGRSCGASCGAGTCTGGACALEPIPAGAVCRAASGACDHAETCDGASSACPPDVLEPRGALCRAAADACDSPETCDGASADCPPDQFQASGVACRPGAGACDAADLCSGGSAVCPDSVASPGSVCRASSGACDEPEKCDGASDACPGPETLFTNSWEDGAGQLNTGGCFAWTNTVGPSALTELTDGAVSEFDGNHYFAYSGIAATDSALYLTFAAAPALHARLMLRVEHWQATDMAHRSIFSFSTNGVPNGWSTDTAIYTRLLQSGGQELFELRAFNGTEWKTVDTFPFTPGTTYQVEMFWHAASAAGASDGTAGWRIWNASGTAQLDAVDWTHASTRLPSCFFLGNGFTYGTTQGVMVLYDAVRVSPGSWIGPHFK